MDADETPLTSPTGGDPRQAERNPVVLRMPVDVRSVALAVIAVLLCLFAMHWAKAVVIPILLGVMTSYALTPAVDLLRRAHVPRAIGAAVVLTSIVAGTAWGAWSLSDQAHALLQSLPQAAQKLRQLTLSTRRDSTSAIAKVEQAAAELEKAAHDSAGTSSRPPARPPAASSWNIKDYLWSGTMGTAVLVGQFAIVLSIALLLLASGDSFRRKMVRLAGPRLSQKKITVQVLDDITGQIQRYLLLQVAFSLIVGLLTWLAFAAIGLEQAAAWGVVAAVTNFIPYLGAAVVGIASTIVALIQFGAIDMGLLVGGTALAIHAVVGNVLTPWLTGKASRIDPFAVLVSLLVFGWLWGVWGLLLGVPVLMVIKAVCDRIEDLKPIGELLGMP